MRRILAWAAAATIFGVPSSGWCQQSDPQAGQQTAAPAAQQQDSLAEAARKAKEAKKEAPKAAKEFTNDNLPGSGGISTVGKDAAPKADETAATDATGSGGAKGEKEWREKFAMLRGKLAHDQADLDVMQREIGVDSVQFNNGDPIKAMQQQLTRDDINKKKLAIDAKTEQVKADQQAIDDAEEELRKSGGDAGWAR